jgi:hypothetical protein
MFPFYLPDIEGMRLAKMVRAILALRFFAVTPGYIASAPVRAAHLDRYCKLWSLSKSSRSISRKFLAVGPSG